MNRSQIFGKTLYYEGDVSYFESVNKETLANAIGWFKQYGIIKTHKGAEPPPKSQYEPSTMKTNANTTWIALAKDWYLHSIDCSRIPAEQLPDAGLPHPDTIIDDRKKSDWDGPLGSFATTVVKTLYDDTATISLSMIIFTDISSTPKS